MYKLFIKSLAKCIITSRKVKNIIKDNKESFINLYIFLISLFVIKINSNYQELISSLDLLNLEILKNNIILNISFISSFLILFAFVKKLNKEVIYIILKVIINTICVLLTVPKLLLVIFFVPFIFDFVVNVYEEYFEEQKTACI